jgi:hypothetical protein
MAVKKIGWQCPEIECKEKARGMGSGNRVEAEIAAKAHYNRTGHSVNLWHLQSNIAYENFYNPYAWEKEADFLGKYNPRE